jgi:hypothetical protein
MAVVASDSPRIIRDYTFTSGYGLPLVIPCFLTAPTPAPGGFSGGFGAQPSPAPAAPAIRVFFEAPGLVAPLVDYTAARWLHSH